MTDQMPTAPRKGGWWDATPEPQVYYCVDLQEQAVMVDRPEASARVTVAPALVQLPPHQQGLGLLVMIGVTCRHGAMSMLVGETTAPWKVAKVAEEHFYKYGCECATFIWKKYECITHEGCQESIREKMSAGA